MPCRPSGKLYLLQLPGLECPLYALYALLGGFSSVGGIPVPLRPVAAPVGVSDGLAGIWA